MLADTEPLDYKVALCDKKWKEAMIDELNSIENNQTWELIELPDGKNVIDVKMDFQVEIES